MGVALGSSSSSCLEGGRQPSLETMRKTVGVRAANVTSPNTLDGPNEGCKRTEDEGLLAARSSNGDSQPKEAKESETIVDALMMSGDTEAYVYIFKWHGTILAGEDHVTIDAMWKEGTTQRQPLPYLEQTATAARKSVSKKRSSRRSVKYDPGEKECLQHHCVDACMYFGLTGCRASLRDALWLRRKIEREWSSAEKAEEIAAILGMTPMDYLETYIRNEGWGGLPEIATYAVATGKQVLVVTPSGHMLYFLKNKHTTDQEVWRYDGIHYCMEKRIEATLRWQESTGEGYSVYLDAMRGGGKAGGQRSTRARQHGWDDEGQPGADRDPRQQTRRRTGRHGWGEAAQPVEPERLPFDPDPRPPLPRRRRMAREESHGPMTTSRQRPSC